MSAIFEPRDELLERLAGRFSSRQLSPVKKALDVAEKAHDTQKRGTGEPYWHHSVAVAMLVDSWHLDVPTITAAVLHDVLEDTDVTLPELKKQFGLEVAGLVEAVTKLAKVRVPREDVDYEVENLRRLFLAMGGDLRVILLKLADRLHNMRTMKGVTPAKRARIGRETLEIFAPLADRLGMGEVRSELEDLGFRYAYSKEYLWTKRQVEQSQDKRTKFMSLVKHEFEQVLTEEQIPSRISGRTKNLHSLYRKLLQKDRDINQIYDLFAIRIVVETVEQCYQGMGIIHRHWQPLPHRIKDYIAVPKLNGYRSLHTTIFGPSKRLLEVQLRTTEMHNEAELGVAAHAVYAEGKMAKTATTEQLAVMSQLTSWRDELHESSEFVDQFKLDLFANRIFVFTPKGALHSLPAGATPIDFAYLVHTEIGHGCVGAKINGVMASLDSTLANGDVVEIQTRRGSAPKRNWLTFVRTGQARSGIRSYFRKLAKDDNIAAGRDVLEGELKTNAQTLRDLSQSMQEKLVSAVKVDTWDELLRQVGEGQLSAERVLRPLGVKPIPIKRGKRPAKAQKISLAGMGSLLTRRSKCCKPVPPVPIVGYVTAGRGISIHRQNCRHLAALPDQSRVIDISWDA